MCKSHKVGPTEFDGNKVEHKCTRCNTSDSVRCLLRAWTRRRLSWDKLGNPESLLYGKDYLGVTCGSINNNMKGKCPYGDDSDCDMTKRMLVTYPEMNDDILSMLRGSFPTDPSK